MEDYELQLAIEESKAMYKKYFGNGFGNDSENDLENDLENDYDLQIAIQQSKVLYDENNKINVNDDNKINVNDNNKTNVNNNNKTNVNNNNSKFIIDNNNCGKLIINNKNKKTVINKKTECIDDDLKFAIEESKTLHNLHKINKIQEIINKEILSTNETIFKLAFLKMNDYQKNIFYECLDKKSAGLSLPLGSGKTLISLILGLYFTIDSGNRMLVIASKGLITNWEFEIKKFFGDILKYEIVHKTMLKVDIRSWKIKQDTKLVLMTVDTLAEFYKGHHVDKKFVHQNYIKNSNVYVNEYVKPNIPFLNHILGGGFFYSIKWGCLIVDEVQKYTNIETLWCQSLGAICAEHRWLLSGTMFDEPKLNRILGYHIILNAEDKPRDLPKTQELIKDEKKFFGLTETLVSREKNEAFIPPKVNEYIITHKLFKEEEKIYTAMKNILVEIRKKAEIAKLYDNIEELQKFNSYKLVMVMYLRQTLTCPLVPITSISIGACDMKRKSELSQIILDELNKNGLSGWLDNIDSVKSSRIVETIKCVDKHPNERIIIFCCFKSYLDILQHYLTSSQRKIFVMTSMMSMKKRQQLLKDFEMSKTGVLLITYQLGAEGLNLQFASTVLLIDFWWNASKTQQAIGRIFRYGQIAEEINVYFFTSNTGIEKMLFLKQKAKLDILNELKVGITKTKIPLIRIDDIIKMIELDGNMKLLKNIKYY